MTLSVKSKVSINDVKTNRSKIKNITNDDIMLDEAKVVEIISKKVA